MEDMQEVEKEVGEDVKKKGDEDIDFEDMDFLNSEIDQLEIKMKIACKSLNNLLESRIEKGVLQFKPEPVLRLAPPNPHLKTPFRQLAICVSMGCLYIDQKISFELNMIQSLRGFFEAI